MIKFIYFDVGGVVMKDVTVKGAWTKFRRDIGIKQEDFDRFDDFFSLHERQACRGGDINDMLPLLAREFSLTFPKGYSILNDFMERFSVNESIVPVIAFVYKKLPIGLLTNMYPGMLDKIRQRHLLPDVQWDAIVDSSVEKAMKPDREIYNIAQKRAGVPAKNILFIDNSKKNVEGAIAAGWQAYWYDQSDCATSSRKLLAYFREQKLA
jgi:FMN phosphatase YigB (HAD superfamily)